MNSLGSCLIDPPQNRMKTRVEVSQFKVRQLGELSGGLVCFIVHLVVWIRLQVSYGFV